MITAMSATLGLLSDKVGVNEYMILCMIGLLELPFDILLLLAITGE